MPTSFEFMLLFAKSKTEPEVIFLKVEFSTITLVLILDRVLMFCSAVETTEALEVDYIVQLEIEILLK